MSLVTEPSMFNPPLPSFVIFNFPEVLTEPVWEIFKASPLFNILVVASTSFAFTVPLMFKFPLLLMMLVVPATG